MRRALRLGSAPALIGVAAAVLAGCGTVPGVGIPPVVLSGKLAAQRITGSRRGHSAG